jgi:hypothetical protein
MKKQQLNSKNRLEQIFNQYIYSGCEIRISKNAQKIICTQKMQIIITIRFCFSTFRVAETNKILII